MAGLRFAGDVRVEKVVVKTLRGLTQNITAQVIGIQIFEDLLSPFITGTIVVDDTLDLMNLFPFTGEELLELKLSTPTMEINGSIDKTFYITKMTDRQLVGDKRVVYQLHFTTIEAVLDLNKALSKTFNGLVSDIVATLLTDKKVGLQLSASDVVIEPTSNRTKYISNFWSPIKNIIYLTSQAINTSNKSPSYMFFQNRDGYNFVSLDALYKTAPIQEFVKDNYSRDDRGSGSVQNAEKDYKRITKLNIPVGIDYMDRMMSGVYGSRQYTHDIVTKRFASQNFDMLKNYKKREHLNPFPSASEHAIYRYGAATSFVPKYYSNFSNAADSTNSAIRQERSSIMKQAESTKIEITVPGRFDYTVGRKVKVTLMKSEPRTHADKDNEDKYFSGFYIISAVNHFIDGTQHECTMELIKDSLVMDLNEGAK